MKVNKTPETYPIQFKDKIDEYLWKEHHILGGCCSSIEEMKYSVAREVAEKLTEAFIEKAKKWFEEHFGNRLKWEITTYEFEDMQSMVEDFKKYMKGE